MSAYSSNLKKLQAEYREKIIATGFKLVVVSDEEAEDGIGFPGNNYMKNGYGYFFDDALAEIGEYENYKAERKTLFEQRPPYSYSPDNALPKGYVSPDMDM